MDLHEYAHKFHESKKATGRAAETLTSYHFAIDRFLAWCDAKGYTDDDLFGVTGAETLEEYQMHMAGLAMSPFTIHGAFRNLRTLYNWIERRFNLADGAGNPFRYLTMPKTPDLLPKAISYAQCLLLLANINTDRYCPTEWVAQRDRVMIRLLFETGPRASELLGLKVSDVDLDNRRLRVMRWKIQKEDYIPFSRGIQGELATWIAQRPACGHAGLWPAYIRAGKQAGPPLAYDGLKEMLRRRCAAAKIPRFTPHCFRHGCGVHIVMRGGDISLVQKILGHQQLSTTEVYLRFNGDQLRSLYDRVFD